jgi:hypothetical protein
MLAAPKFWVASLMRMEKFLQPLEKILLVKAEER